MRTRVDERLRSEATRFAFRFACEDCAHFACPSDSASTPAVEGVCSLGYAPAPRRDGLAAAHVELCKTFELG